MFQEMNGLLKHLFQKTHVSPTIRNYLVIMRILWIWRKTDKLIHHICVACTTAKMLQCLPTNEVSTIVSHHYDDVLKRRFHMIPHAFGHTKFTFGKLWTRLFCWNFEVKKWKLLFTVLFTIHYSLLLFIALFIPNFYLFKGGYPLSLTQSFFFQKLSSKPFLKREFLVSTLRFPTTFPTIL